MTERIFPVVADTEREFHTRRTADGGETHSILMRRCYDAPVGDVWDACTDPDRLARFFARPGGDLRPGGTFRLEGNAHGEILRCEPPRLLRITWCYGDAADSQVELRLSPVDDARTLLELEHSAPGPLTDVLLNDPEAGLWGLGTGWDLGLVGLEAHLLGTFPDADPIAVATESPYAAEIAAMAEESSRAWAAVLAAAREQPGSDA